MDLPPFPSDVIPAQAVPARVPEDDGPPAVPGTEPNEPGAEAVVGPNGQKLPKRGPGRPKALRTVIEPKRRLGKRQKNTDDSVGRLEWERALKAFTKSGLPKEIAKEASLTVTQAVHLIEYGVVRLSLPPIREFALRPSSIAKRSIAEVNDQLAQDREDNLGIIQEAATQRAASEAAAAVSLMNTTLKAADVVAAQLDLVVQKIKDEGAKAFELPEQLSGNWIRNMVKTAQDLANAVDLASQINRRVSGQPERNLALEISNAVCALPPAAMKHYLHTGEFPKELRLLKSSQLAEAIAAGRSIRVIEAESRVLASPSSTGEAGPDAETSSVEASFRTAADPLAGTYPDEQVLPDQQVPPDQAGAATEGATPEEAILKKPDP